MLSKMSQAVDVAGHALLDANGAQKRADDQKMAALYDLLDSVADARTKLKKLKAKHGNAAVKAGLRPLRAK